MTHNWNQPQSRSQAWPMRSPDEAFQAIKGIHILNVCPKIYLSPKKETYKHYS